MHEEISNGIKARASAVVLQGRDLISKIAELCGLALAEAEKSQGLYATRYIRFVAKLRDDCEGFIGKPKFRMPDAADDSDVEQFARFGAGKSSTVSDADLALYNSASPSERKMLLERWAGASGADAHDPNAVSEERVDQLLSKTTTGRAILQERAQGTQ